MCNKKITAEIKSLNSKQMDLSVKLPLAYRDIELELRNFIAKELGRGKVDVFIASESIDTGAAAQLNVEVLKSYKKQIVDIAQAMEMPLPDDWYATLLRMPDVYKQDVNGEVEQEELDGVREAVKQALKALTDFRCQEGEKLSVFFKEKIAAIQQIFGEVEQYETSRVERIKARIIDSLAKLDGVEYDNNRLEQELIFYIEKLDITEEKIRLQNHINYFLETLHASEPGQGKKLGFISQEMGREINTMGSKANQAELQQVVVRMKDQLEQIKEQVLNVL